MAQINEWLSIDKNSGTGNAYVTLTASSYDELQQRAASLKVKTESKEVILTVQQKPITYHFVLYNKLVSSEWEGGAKTITFTTSNTWKLTLPDWITANKTSGSAGVRQTVTLTLQPNLLETNRVGDVVFTSQGGNSVLETVKVAQATSNDSNNIIFYTSTDDKEITPYSSTGIIARTYENGVGAYYYGDTLTEIPKNLFRERNKLATVDYPSTVTTVKEYAFYNCYNLSSFDFSKNLVTIEQYAFYKVDDFESIVFPSTLRTIGTQSFALCYCPNIVLNDGLQTIGEYGLYANDITEITIPDSVTSLGKDVLGACNKLTSVTIGKGVTTIPYECFYNCSKLESITIPSQITKIDSNAFNNCTSLADIYFEKRTEHLTINGFSNTQLFNVYVDSLKDWLLIDAQYITSTARNLYVNNELLTEVVVDWTETIGIYQFYNNPNITRIVLGKDDGETVVTLRDYCFRGLNNTSYLEINGCVVYSLDSSSNYNFSDLDGEYVVNNHMSDISEIKFNNCNFTTVRYNCTGNENITADFSTMENFYLNGYNNTISNINTTSLINFEVNGGDNKIGEYLFLDKSLLFDTVDFSAITEIGYRAFEDTNIKTLVNYENVKIINGAAFSGCGYLEGDLVFADNYYLGDNCFQYCSKLNSVTLGDWCTVGDSSFQNCSSLKSVTLGNSCSVGSYSFRNCSSLKSVTLGDECRLQIDRSGYYYNSSYVFADCTSLTDITLGENIILGGEDIFSNCTSLQEITIPLSIGNLPSSTFENCSNLKYIKMSKLPFEGEEKETNTGFATITGSYNTGIVPNGDTRLEFWYKNDGTFSQYNNVIGSQQGGTSDGIFKIIEWGANQYKLEYDSFSCTFTMDEGWHHIVISKSEGLVVDDVVQADLSGVTFKNTNTPFYINSNYYENKKANGTFGKIIIDDHIIVPTEYGFYDTTLEMLLGVVDNGSYEFESDGGETIIVKLVVVYSVPTITNYTFRGVSEYGFLDYPLEMDFSSWLSTDSYYLGYYKWNRFDLSATELDFDAADTYEVTVDNGVPYTWEITQLPFWLTASVMSGGEGTTTITFTKIADYVESDNIIFSITGVNYVIKAKYSIRELDLTNVDSCTIDLDTEGFTTRGVTDWVTVVSENGTTTFTGGIVYADLSTEVRFTNGDEKYVVRCVKDGTDTPLPKADNRIYYTGGIRFTPYTEYGTNGVYVSEEYYGGGLSYIEYDRPITHIYDSFLKGSPITRLSLPSSLLYIVKPNLWNGGVIYGSEAFSENNELIEVDFGGNELYIGNLAFTSTKLKRYNLPQTLQYLGRCAFGGYTSFKEEMGAEIIDIGADMKYIAGGTFSGCGNTKRINFWGMTPPVFEEYYSVDLYHPPFHILPTDCEIHTPIGSDYYTPLVTNLGLNVNIIADLEAKPKTNYGEPKWLDNGVEGLVKPACKPFYMFWNGEDTVIPMLSSTHNYAKDIVYENVTRDDITLTYGVRGELIKITDFVLKNYCSNCWPNLVGTKWYIYGENIVSSEIIFPEFKAFYEDKSRLYDEDAEGRVAWNADLIRKDHSSAVELPSLWYATAKVTDKYGYSATKDFKMNYNRPAPRQ